MPGRLRPHPSDGSRDPHRPRRRRRRRLTGALAVSLVPATLALVGSAAWPGTTRAGAAAPAPLQAQLVWSKTLPGAAFRASSPMPATLDAQGPSVVIGSLNGSMYAFHLNDGSGVAGWPVNTGHEIDSTPSATSLDGSGVDDVFIGTGSADTPGGDYRSYGPGGNLRWVVAAKDPNQASAAVEPTLALGDVNGTGVAATAGALGLDAYSIDAASGSVEPGWPVATNDTVFSSPSLAHLNGPGPFDVVTGGDSTAGYPIQGRNTRPVPQGGVLYAFDGTGNLLWYHYF
ncbi:MAG TPA: hypothetical protein VGR90_03805, partial [Acidimicrobiales bacterium]|nr:hypothetical protein [Acidimicrobiales bacterium]